MTAIQLQQPALLPADIPLVINSIPRFGQFEHSLSQINADQFHLRNPFGRPVSRFSNWLGFKQFQYFGGMSDRLIFGCALAHLRHTAAVFLYVHDLKTGKLFSRSYRAPLGIGMTLCDNPVSGESRFHWRHIDIRLGYQGSPRSKSLSIKIGQEFFLEATMPENQFEPMSLCTRTAYTGWVYANKTAGLNLQGSLRYEGGNFDLGELNAMGHHDFSCGFMRRETYWNWACFSGMADGHRIGLNLSCGVNETSYTENCLWIDDKLFKVNLTRFEFNQQDLMQPWHVWSDDGQVNLYFSPVGQHHEQLDVILVASNFRQIFGRFSGTLKTKDHTIAIKDLSGFVEDQYIKW